MIHLNVNMDGLEEIEAALGMAKDKSKAVLKTAINNTVKELERKDSGEAKKRYKFKSGKVSDIREANKINKATVGRLYGVFSATGKINELTDFVVSPPTYFPGSKGAPSWIMAKQLRGGKLHKIALRPESTGDKYKAFVVKYHSGHKALAQRVPGSHMKSNPHKEAIKSLYATSIPKMEEVVYRDKVEPDVYDMLQRNITEQINRYLG